MSSDLQREVRFLLVATLIVGGYALAVTAVASFEGKMRLLSFRGIGETMGAIWLIIFCFIFIAYAVDLLVRRRPESPVAAMIADARANVLRPDALIARATVVVSWFVMMRFFTPLKVIMGHAQGFPHDDAFADLDAALFLGNDPWTITHAIFGGAFATYILQFFYSFWYVLMWVSIIYPTLRSDRVELRVRYITAFLLLWIIVGSIAAWTLASAGPCYFERAFGDPRFAPLMARLAEIDTELGAYGLQVTSLFLQDILWQGFTGDRTLLGGGISAMPSMHVALAVLIALGGQAMNRRLGWALWVYAAVIWIGSVHLGWHYAADGLVGGVMALGVWRLAGVITDRYVMAERTDRQAVPA